jgi:hypothetical protein
VCREVERDEAAVKMPVVHSVIPEKHAIFPLPLWVGLWGLEYSFCCVFDSLRVDKTMCEKRMVECLAVRCMQEPSCAVEGVGTYLYAGVHVFRVPPGLSPRWGRVLLGGSGASRQ